MGTNNFAHPLQFRNRSEFSPKEMAKIHGNREVRPEPRFTTIYFSSAKTIFEENAVRLFSGLGISKINKAIKEQKENLLYAEGVRDRTRIEIYLNFLYDRLKELNSAKSALATA